MRERNNDMHSWHLFIIKLNSADERVRNKFIEDMNDLNIGCSVHYIPLHRHPYWRDRYNLKVNEFSTSENLYRQIVSLPIYYDLSDNEVEYIIKSIKSLI